MRRVVGGDDIDSPVAQSVAQGVAVGAGFDCRIAFEPHPQPRIIVVAKKQMMRAGLGGDLLVAVAGRE